MYTDAPKEASDTCLAKNSGEKGYKHWKLNLCLAAHDGRY